MAFEWNPTKEKEVFESWWTSTLLPKAKREAQEEERRRQISASGILKTLNTVGKTKIFNQQTNVGSGYDRYKNQWTSYLNSYLKTEVEKSKQQAEAEKVAQQAQIAQAEQDYATTAKQAEESQLQAKRISAVADFQGEQIAEQARQVSALAMQSQTQPVQQRKKTQIGQPGVSRTRLTSGTTVGGYGGTSAGNVNPTGLNI